jgi:hypothetical protein
VARQKAEWILANHHPEELDPARRVELSKIISAADKELD